MKKNETAICSECNEEVPYTMSKVKRLHLIGHDKVPVEVEEWIGHCAICGAPLLPNKYWALNDIIIYDEYKRKLGLLTSEDIKRIRKKRGMSQVELAHFIQCGEKNIARYENGAVQDRVFDLLIRLVDDDKIYEQMKKLNKTLKTNRSINLELAQ